MRRFRSSRTAALAMVAAMLSTTAQADALDAAVEKAVRPLLSDDGAPGIAIAVTADGERRFFNFGVASKASGQGVTENTLFEIGSVSKTFTATLGCAAAAVGKISLDDHPSRFMPELSGADIDRASLLDLGAYAAGGLPLQFPDAVTDAGMAAYFKKWRASAPPGETRAYSNPSIGLFGHLAAKAMGGRFAELMEADLFSRLGLKSTFVHPPEAAMAAYAWGYDRAGRAVRVNPGVFDAEAYGVKSTAADMIGFVEANIAPQKLDAPLGQAIACSQTGYFRAGPIVQGLGWERLPYPITLDRLLEANAPDAMLKPLPATRLSPTERGTAGVLFDKTGSTGGFGAYVAFSPERRIGLVMLANRNTAVPARITAAHAILEALAAQAD